MALLTVRIYGDPCLKEVSKSVNGIDGDLKKIFSDMLETMYASHGVGLAAPQVGVNLRFFVTDVDWVNREDGVETGKRNSKIFINPEITEESEEDGPASEGCLSVPGIEGDVYRSLRVKMRYLDENGETHENAFEGLEARCVQHELDHLDGVLFVDRMPFVRRRLLAGKLNQLKKERIA